MSASINETGTVESELAEALESAVRVRFGPARRIAEIFVRDSDYASSFALRELDLTLDNGSALGLLVKNTGAQGLLPAGLARPGHIHAPHREIEVYREVLPALGPGTAELFTAVTDRENQGSLVLERVEGPLLWQTEGLTYWLRAAKWLAEFHSSASTSITADLPRYDLEYVERWLRLAVEPRPSASNQARKKRLLAALESSSFGSQLCALPASLVHGDFFSSNVIVSHRDMRLRICPVDWEMAAFGPSLLDLAALTSGGWSSQERECIARAYYENIPEGTYADFGAFMAELDLCALQVALQFLAWPQDWERPSHQTFDWLGEAERLAKRVAL